MPPIRAGLTGLSGSPPDKYQGLGWAASALLPYLLDSEAYTFDAICNTSVESARCAVRLHNLPDSTKTYGNVEELAADPDIDLVVSCVRVDKHYPTIIPALRNGKSVFVEWPLGANLQEAEEMAAFAKRNNARSLVGLQGAVCSDVRTIEELLTAGRVGKVLSSSSTCSMGIGSATEQ
ncbi:NAD-P-binding protein [Stereum hirsutum FP-91666 SS1]|uniref:NAD-P-binding protein n=1 Tax=Stereum hirsutum (strain FP-91666) TaxID=721885 RepID=UPI000444A606|nr:NAD-P-binding protein [Stereum hirsutum FP-91666 SS1]EIM83426.1 NAD-P-binding protein [Stereum hirsutum FP-91666 SS1]